MAKATKPKPSKPFKSQAAFASALKVNPSTLLRWLRRKDWPAEIPKLPPWDGDDRAVLLSWRANVVQSTDDADDDDDDADIAQLLATEKGRLRAMARASELEIWADNAEAVILDLPSIAADLAGLDAAAIANKLDQWAARAACILRGEPLDNRCVRK